MNNITIVILKALRKGYQKIIRTTRVPYDMGITNPDEASKVIYNLLASGKPCMIARYGAFELATTINYLGVTSFHPSAWKFIKGEQPEWWWNKNLMRYMQTNAGFFPSTDENLMKFGKLMVEDSLQVDVLGSWLPDEKIIIPYMKEDVKRCSLLLLEPYWSSTPWSRILEGKRVVVVHPFAESIRKQYEENREHLFKNKEVLPQFCSLRVVKAVQSLGGECNGFKDWFEALEWMKNEIDKEEYDICLIGCGAYGFPLAAHVKRTGHQAVHLGGALQLLFGIKGKRWENPEYGVNVFRKQGCYPALFNQYWIRPTSSIIPTYAKQVEGGCYW